jgi:rubrerythrin
VRFGQTVYDVGEEVGRVQDVQKRGFYVTTVEGVSTTSQAERKAGEKTLLWRCGECGEIGDIEDVPPLCPSSGATGESIYYCQED